MRRKYKTKLEKLKTETHTGPFQPSMDDCVKWFRILNREIFGSLLCEIPEIDIRVRRRSWAYYSYSAKDGKPIFEKTKLCMNKKYMSKKHFVEVLSHEMVHHYQWTNGKPMGHGPSFHRWRREFNKKGLRLLEIGYED